MSPNGSSGLQGKLQALLQTQPPLLSPEEQREKYSASLSQKSKNFEKESSEQGKVKMTVYRKYVGAASRIGVALYIAAILGQQGLTICMRHEFTFFFSATCAERRSQGRILFFAPGVNVIVRPKAMPIRGTSFCNTVPWCYWPVLRRFWRVLRYGYIVLFGQHAGFMIRLGNRLLSPATFPNVHSDA